ncbi:hypothetical protein [Streptomyces sp. B6B3]|uniref:hypothetical protein n=1 Tax=Streptomyces sp. B6B3 TaxID=3153570 RepID=UPI00325DD38F
MSIPGGNPNPYMQPSGSPQPAPNNPYAQPAQPAQPASSGPPPPGPPPGANHGYPQQQAAAPSASGYGPMVTPNPPVSSRSGRGLPSWLWAVGGVVVASAVWGGVLVATGGPSEAEPQEPSQPQPNLAGYEYNGQMCDTADTTSFDRDYQADGYNEPSSLAAEHDRVDQSACTFYLAPVQGDGYSSLYLTYQAVWHKGTDPKQEFEASYRSQEQYEDVNYDYQVEPVDGLGDEAYIIYQTNSVDARLSRVTLGVRDGWFEYTLIWDAYIDTTSDASLDYLMEQDYVTEAMRESSMATLAALQGSEQGGGSGGTGDTGELEGDVPPDA